MLTTRKHKSNERQKEKLERLFNQAVTKQLGMSFTAKEARGYVDYDDESPGKFIIYLLTSTGVESYLGARLSLGSDAQSGALNDPDERACAAEIESWNNDSEVPATTLWSRLSDESTNAARRLDALQKLLASDTDATVSWVAEELAREDLSDEWRNGLVFLAEDIHFPVSLRQRLGERLLAIAMQLRPSTKAGIDKVVWSAMRRAFSLLPPDPGRILPFLERQGSVDTRSVALRCIERLFEPGPPSNSKELEPVADRVKDFAFKFLDPDVFAGGENALIAQNAVCALASLGDPRLGEALRDVKILGRRWLNRPIRVRLEQLLAGWRSRGGTVETNPAFRNLEEQLRSLS